MRNRKHSPETIEKIRAARLGSKHPMWGKKHSPEAIKKMREIKLGHRNPNWKGDEAAENTIRNRLIKDVPVPKGYERHHIDGNVRNSDPSNILILTRKQHMIKDGRMEALIRRNEEMIGSKHPCWKGDSVSDASKNDREYRARRRAKRVEEARELIFEPPLLMKARLAEKPQENDIE